LLLEIQLEVFGKFFFLVIYHADDLLCMLSLGAAVVIDDSLAEQGCKFGFIHVSLATVTHGKSSQVSLADLVKVGFCAKNRDRVALGVEMESNLLADSL
jgi:uncharacterized membrane protein